MVHQSKIDAKFSPYIAFSEQKEQQETPSRSVFSDARNNFSNIISDDLAGGDTCGSAGDLLESFSSLASACVTVSEFSADSEEPLTPSHSSEWEHHFDGHENGCSGPLRCAAAAASSAGRSSRCTKFFRKVIACLGGVTSCFKPSLNVVHPLNTSLPGAISPKPSLNVVRPLNTSQPGAISPKPSLNVVRPLSASLPGAISQDNEDEERIPASTNPPIRMEAADVEAGPEYELLLLQNFLQQLDQDLRRGRSSS
ncbi:hypothetical protein PLESTB_001376600 [Pleodorina starrii]|uniref:Uncharacterized protein n=1 Tax=Pleodorina starrii TaxID=330485 RepID=A0A9W6BV23_9CHLO|nr:hypothetical protein PLESTB_001376600 [Pleodorina starrii]